MIEDLKPYSAIKDSGVPWLGEVPEHWEVLPLYAVARPRNQTNQPHRELLSVYLGRGVIPFSAVEDKRTNPTSEDLSKYQAVEPGDFVLNNQQAWRGSVGVSRHKGIVSPAYLVLNLDGRLRMEFADRLLTGRAMVAQYLVSSKGVGSIQRNLYWPHLRRVAVLVPPSVEQAAIVRFLDYEDRRIRRYIRAKQKLIKLLEEQKQAIVHRAVTRGLDPNVRFKPSGVGWLGDLPEHWKVLPARYLFRAVTRRGFRGDEVKLSVTQRRGLVPTDQMEENSTQASSFDRFQVCEPGDLVLNKYKAHLGVFWAATSRGLITPNYTVFKPERDVVSRYFELLFHTRPYRDAFSMTVYGVTEGMSPLYTQDFYSIPTVAPPHREQARIVAWIDEQTMREEAAIRAVEREIELVREYRIRLVADLVTGKLDVREAAARLPQEVEDLEPLDKTEDEDYGEENDGGDGDGVREEVEA